MRLQRVENAETPNPMNIKISTANKGQIINLSNNNGLENRIQPYHRSFIPGVYLSHYIFHDINIFRSRGSTGNLCVQTLHIFYGMDNKLMGNDHNFQEYLNKLTSNYIHNFVELHRNIRLLNFDAKKFLHFLFDAKFFG